MNTTKEEFTIFQNWKNWVKLLDASLMGGYQSTFTALAILESRIFGVTIGDNRIYKCCREGNVILLSHGSSKKRLGSGEIMTFPIHQIIHPGEIVSIMTDGAWGPLSIQKISSLFRRRLNIHKADLPDKMIQEAGKYGRCDDMTIINIYF